MGEYDDTIETEQVADWAKPKPKPRDIRSSAAYKALQSQFIDHHRLRRRPDGSYGSPCAICGRDIDYRLRHPHPQSPSLDHIRSVREAPELALNWENCQPAHLVCNMRRQGLLSDDDLDIGEPSEVW